MFPGGQPDLSQLMKQAQEMLADDHPVAFLFQLAKTGVADARIEAVRVVDMSSSNSWAEFAGVYRTTRQAVLDHEQAKGELKALMPEDAKEAVGHGIRGRRSKSGAVTFDILESEVPHAALQ